MAEILVEEAIQKEDTSKDEPKARLEKFLRENNIKVFGEKDFDFPKDKEIQAKTRVEVDEFLEMREQWRSEDRKLAEERDK